MIEVTRASSNFADRVTRLAARLPKLLSAPAFPSTVPSSRPRRHARQLGQQQVARLVAEYEAGADMKALAASWGLHRNTVARHLKRAGVELRRQGMQADRLDEAVRLYGEGWSCRRLGERYGCDTETVRQALERVGMRRGNGWERR